MGNDYLADDATMVRPRVLVDPSAIAYEQRQRRAAARHVASRAHDAVDCTDLLEMLGLTAKEGAARG